MIEVVWSESRDGTNRGWLRSEVSLLTTFEPELVGQTVSLLIGITVQNDLSSG